MPEARHLATQQGNAHDSPSPSEQTMDQHDDVARVSLADVDLVRAMQAADNQLVRLNGTMAILEGVERAVRLFNEQQPLRLVGQLDQIARMNLQAYTSNLIE